MRRWSFFATLCVLGVTGVLTVVLTNLILGYGSDGLNLKRVWSDPEGRRNLAVAVLPTALFLAAGVLCRRSVAMQLCVASTAAVATALLAGAVSVGLSNPFDSGRTGPGSRELSAVASDCALLLAVVTLLSSAVVAIRRVCPMRKTCHIRGRNR
jgi:hypothetical protein